VDEEQEHTYKSENSPRYHSREVTIYRGAKEQSLVVLGSATPSIETMFFAQSGVYGYARLEKSILFRKNCGLPLQKTENCATI
jgi:primosomal protein N' (replication factor Y)